jgi:hypothetical protein
MNFCEVSKDEIGSISNSYSEAFPEVDPDLVHETLTWKFFSKVNPGHYWVLYGESNQDIIAGYGIMDMPIDSDEKYGLVADVYTAPRYQNQGMFTKIGHSVRGPISELKYDFSIGFPVRKNVIPGHLKVGWINAFSMPVLGSISLIKAARSFLSSKYWQANIEHRKFIEISDDVLFFLSELSSTKMEEIRISKRYTREYLEWRLSRPDTDYFETMLRDDNGISAWILSRKAKIKGVPIWVILDIQVKSPKSKSYKFLLRYLGRVAILNNCWVLAGCWNPTHSKYLGLSLKSGFVSLGKQDVIYRAYRDDIVFPDEAHSRFSWMDSDTL